MGSSNLWELKAYKQVPFTSVGHEWLLIWTSSSSQVTALPLHQNNGRQTLLVTAVINVFYTCFLSWFFKPQLLILFRSQRLTDCRTTNTTNAVVAATRYSRRIYCADVTLNFTWRYLDLADCLDPVQVTCDPGEACRISQLTTSRSGKRNDADLCIGTVYLRD
jgi:hypothetical protein